MQTLIFASNNAYKLQEMNALADGRLGIISLREAGIDQDIPEPFPSLQENAFEKCRVIASLTGKDCFSEDTGLETDALNGAPGVTTARYAGTGATATANMEKLLAELDGATLRTARFRTVICLFSGGTVHYFEGVCEGSISVIAKGEYGFGYDPVFIPDGSTLTFAEMDAAAKKDVSHRRKAFDKLFLFLSTNQPQSGI
jgi:XTP/dITP diphosphohydrolase